jgi:hypothetical protein
MNALTECRNDAPPTPASKAPILQSVKPSFQNLTLITPLSVLPSLTSSLAASLAKIYNPKPPLLLANNSSSLGSTECLRFAPKPLPSSAGCCGGVLGIEATDFFEARERDRWKWSAKRGGDGKGGGSCIAPFRSCVEWLKNGLGS